ncbi:MAG: ECF transporter S component [Butyricicoccus sp.]
MTKTMKITYTALFAAIATVLMQFEFPVPLMPPFLKIDLSGAAILIGAFIFGIGPGIAMALIKDLIHATMTQTGGSGELQDFILMVVLVVVAVSIYKRHRSRKGALIGCLVASVAMACTGMLTNYFLIIPFYSKVMMMPLEAIFGACAAINPYISGMGTYLLIGVLPFNIIKGAIITIITMLVYKKLSVFIKSKQFGVHHTQHAE